MNQPPNIIANTLLGWDMPQPQNAPLSLEEQKARISQWLASIKGKLQFVSRSLEASHSNLTDEVIALHKALDWLEEAENHTKHLNAKVEIAETMLAFGEAEYVSSSPELAEAYLRQQGIDPEQIKRDGLARIKALQEKLKP